MINETILKGGVYMNYINRYLVPVILYNDSYGQKRFSFLRYQVPVTSANSRGYVIIDNEKFPIYYGISAYYVKPGIDSFIGIAARNVQKIYPELYIPKMTPILRWLDITKRENIDIHKLREMIDDAVKALIERDIVV